MLLLHMVPQHLLSFVLKTNCMRVCVRGGGGVDGIKILQILIYMDNFEVPENNKVLRNTVYGAPVVCGATSPIMTSPLVL